MSTNHLDPWTQGPSPEPIPTVPYLVASAMRGPDEDVEKDFEDLKWHLTARIRALYYTPSTCNGLLNTHPMTQYDLDLVNERMARVHRSHPVVAFHFLSHLRAAILSVPACTLLFNGLHVGIRWTATDPTNMTPTATATAPRTGPP